ncbi:hypothetical protein ONA91_12115 [Micromonospora sp. DR5-3]|uniref:hypothetical protein n=1 Tax=unclassified Micromonospora TaxID=2617518 RepID=UPI0011D56AD1|nr:MULTISPECIES: hypothetical protein [unclassified Micromonospora]MCW3815201.1 hypothetical protein [Micromonospora sp. DR5-3]TYC22235.1 hypothetical protein FXF52_21810 [Micromonospora sp. MP36]
MRRTREELAASRSGGRGFDAGMWAILAVPVLFLLGLTLGGVLLLVRGVDATLAEYSGVPGRVEVTRCTPDGRVEGRWHCSGTFVADDEGFHIRDVTIEPYLEGRPTAPVDVRVSGRDATQAWTSSGVPFTAIGGGLAFLGIVGWGVWSWFRDDDPEEGLSKRARRRLERQRKGRAGPPQLGNRARRRRRKRRLDQRQGDVPT